MMLRFIRTRMNAWVVPIAVLVLAACSSSDAITDPPPPPSTGGWLTIELTTPRTNDGAVQLAVTGPEVDSVKVIGYDGFGITSGIQADVVVTGDITSGTVARIYVRNLARATEYVASVAAAAARDTYDLQPLDGYRAVLVR